MGAVLHDKIPSFAGGKTMGTIELGVNSDSIKFEVAIEILGQELQPFVSALAVERQKAAPSAALVGYYQARIDALREFQDVLDVADLDAINSILDRTNKLIRI